MYPYFLFVGIITSFFSFSSFSYANDNYGAIEFYEVSSTSEPVVHSSSSSEKSSTEQSSQQSTVTEPESSSSEEAMVTSQKPSGMQPSLGELQKMGMTVGGFLVILLVLVGFWIRNKKYTSHK